MSKLYLSLIAIFTAVSGFTAPFSYSNFYVDGFGGLNLVSSLEEQNIRIDLNSGYVLGGSLGYRFSRYFRLETEAAYRSNTFEQLTIDDIHLPASGRLQKVTAMANGIFDFPLLEGALIPYIGGGLGQHWDKERFKLEPIATPEGIYFFDTLKKKSSGMAYQVILGLTFIAGHKVHASAEYRYLDGPRFQANHSLALNLKRYF